MSIEEQFEALFAHIGDMTTLASTLASLWQFVEDKPAGEALARRLGRKTREQEK